MKHLVIRQSKGREDEIISSGKAYQRHCYVCSGVQACQDTQSVLCPERAPITKPRRRLPRLLVGKTPHSFPRRREERKNLEGRQTLTNRDSSVFRLSLDVHLQTGGLDRYGTHDSRHVPPGSKAGIRHRASLRESFTSDGPRQTFNSLRLFWHSAQTAVLHRRAGGEDFHLDCARPPVV